MARNGKISVVPRQIVQRLRGKGDHRNLKSGIYERPGGVETLGGGSGGPQKGVDIIHGKKII